MCSPLLQGEDFKKVLNLCKVYNRLNFTQRCMKEIRYTFHKMMNYSLVSQLDLVFPFFSHKRFIADFLFYKSKELMEHLQGKQCFQVEGLHEGIHCCKECKPFYGNI